MKYKVYAPVVGSVCVGTFEAENEQAAIDAAIDSGFSVSVCYHCAKVVNEPQVDWENASAEKAGA